MRPHATTGKTIKIADTQARVLAPYGALPTTGFVRLADLRQIIPLSDSSIWRRVKAGTFPTPVKLSERVTAWRAEAIRAWLDEQGQAA
ncbi:helix-turn-helix transcriptional regulator [Aquitalea denitrificans]|uniref:helix-turn-helix transcriptional regulator n=1 Tax=Aquitalea denitrificans TaxID=519081 RepID=UPI0013599ED8|nr:AlpA family phage regulatory protein [Aquitalea denitrificans]